MNYNIETKVIAESDLFVDVQPYTGERIQKVLVLAELVDVHNVTSGSYIVVSTEVNGENLLVGPMVCYETEEQAWHKYNALLKANEAKHIKLGFNPIFEEVK